MSYDIHETRTVTVKGTDYDIPHNVYRYNSGWLVKIQLHGVIQTRNFPDADYGGIGRSCAHAIDWRHQQFFGKASALKPVVPRLRVNNRGDLFVTVSAPWHVNRAITKYVGKDGYVTEAKIEAVKAILLAMRKDSIPLYLAETERVPTPDLMPYL